MLATFLWTPLRAELTWDGPAQRLRQEWLISVGVGTGSPLCHGKNWVVFGGRRHCTAPKVVKRSVRPDVDLVTFFSLGSTDRIAPVFFNKAGTL